MKSNNVLFCYLILTSTVIGQRNFSLKDAINISLENNYGIKIIRKDLESARINNNWFNAGAFPIANLTVSPNLISNTIDQKFVNNTEIKRPNAVQKNLGAAVELNYNVLNGFKLFVTKDKLSQIEKLSEADLQIKILDVYKEVSETYFKILSLQNTLQTLKGQETIANNRKELEEQRFKLGKGGKSPFIEASIDLKDIKILISKQNQVIKESQNKLLKLLRIDPATDLRLTDSLTSDKLKMLTLEDCNVVQSVQMNQYQILSKINKLEQDEIKRDRYPNIRIVADYHYNKSVNQAGFNLFNQSYGPGIGLQLSIPIYDAQKIKREVTQSKIYNEQIQLQMESWKLDADYLIWIEKEKIKDQFSTIELESEKFQLASENLEIIQKKSVLGEANPFDYSQAQFKLIQSSASKNDALLEIINSYIQIHYLCSDLEKLLQ